MTVTGSILWQGRGGSNLLLGKAVVTCSGFIISPSSSNLMSLAACIPSSFRFFSICLLRARLARSSALMAQPMMMAWRGGRSSLLEGQTGHEVVTLWAQSVTVWSSPGYHCWQLRLSLGSDCCQYKMAGGGCCLLRPGQRLGAGGELLYTDISSHWSPHMRQKMQVVVQSLSWYYCCMFVQSVLDVQCVMCSPHLPQPHTCLPFLWPGRYSPVGRGLRLGDWGRS